MFLSRREKYEEFKSSLISLEAKIRMGITNINNIRAENSTLLKRKEEFTFDEIMSFDSFSLKRKQFKNCPTSELTKAEITILSSSTYRTNETNNEEEERKRTRGIFYIKKLSKIENDGAETFYMDIKPYYEVYVLFNAYKAVLANLSAYIDYEFSDLRCLELIQFVFEEKDVVLPKIADEECYEDFVKLLESETNKMNEIQNSRSEFLKEHMKVSKHRNKRKKE